MTPAASGLFGVAFLALIAWRLYRRARKLIGRQASRLWRYYVSVIVLPLLLLLIGSAAALAHREALAGLLGGIAIGIGLAVWGLRLTRFERTEDGWYYTPNAHIGIALTVILVVRIVWRVAESGMWRIAFAGGSPGNMPAPPPDLMRSPLTLAILGTLLAYYAAYGAGLLRWRLASR